MQGDGFVNITPFPILDSHPDSVVGGGMEPFDDSFAVLVGLNPFKDFLPFGFDPHTELDIIL